MKVTRINVIFIFILLLLFFQFFRFLYTNHHEQAIAPRTFVLGTVASLDTSSIRNFMLSVKFLGLNTKLFYNKLEEAVVVHYSTINLQFLHVESVFGSSTFTSQFHVLYNYLKGYAVANDKVILVHPEKVFFYKDPFPEIHYNKLYVSQDIATTRANKHVAKALKTCLSLDVHHFEYNKRAYNTNVIAGTWEVVQPLLKCIMQYNIKKSEYCEVAALNFCLHYKFVKKMPWNNNLINTKHLHCAGEFTITQNNCHVLTRTKEPCLKISNNSLILETC